MKTNTTELSTTQQKAIIDTKKTVHQIQKVSMVVGQSQAFNLINKLVTVTELKLLLEIKESKSYKGFTYENEKGELVTVTTWEDFCKNVLGTDVQNIDNRLRNLARFGDEFFEASQKMGLGYRQLRKLAQLTPEKQALIMSDKAAKAFDKEAVEYLIEDATLQLKTELADTKKRADEAEQTVEAVRENSASKQKLLDDIKEREAKMRLDPKELSFKVSGLIDGIISAGVSITQASNQLKEIYEVIREEGMIGNEFDEKELQKITRMLVSQIKESFSYFSYCTEDSIHAFGYLLEDGHDLQEMILSHYSPEEKEEYENLPTLDEIIEMDK